MKSLQENKKIGHDEVEGVSEDQIRKVEQSLKIKFPAVYKEFLFLAGEYHGNLKLFPGHNDLEMLSKETVRRKLHEMITTNDIKITRPIWPVTEMDGFEYFLFFYLDENKENPELWIGAYNDEKSKVEKLGKTLSKYIDDVVKDSVLYEERGY